MTPTTIEAASSSNNSAITTTTSPCSPMTAATNSLAAASTSVTSSKMPMSPLAASSRKASVSLKLFRETSQQSKDDSPKKHDRNQRSSTLHSHEPSRCSSPNSPLAFRRPSSPKSFLPELTLPHPALDLETEELSDSLKQSEDDGRTFSPSSAHPLKLIYSNRASKIVNRPIDQLQSPIAVPHNIPLLYWEESSIGGNSISTTPSEWSDIDDTEVESSGDSSDYDSGSNELEEEPFRYEVDVEDGSHAINIPATSAIALQPYKHQVGGHSSIFQFSKKALCKPLNSRENEFYEAIELNCPQLLAFVPRYLGVLNVNYRKVTSGEETEAYGSPEREVFRPEFRGTNPDEIPEVDLELNTHIIPESLLWNGLRGFKQLRHRSKQSESSPELAPVNPERGTSLPNFNEFLATEDYPKTPHSSPADNSYLSNCSKMQLPLDSLSQRISTSPSKNSTLFMYGTGSTVVNTRLCEQVLREAFSSPKLKDRRLWLQGRRRRGSSNAITGSQPESNIGTPLKQLPLRSTASAPTCGSSTPPSSTSMTFSPALATATSELDDPMFNLDDVEAKSSQPYTPTTNKNPESFVTSTVRASPVTPNIALTPEAPVPSRTEKFILMEDLTGSFKRPCALDLKMGTRQYGIMATPKKVASQTQKCKDTTSYQLGVRICGTQVYHPSDDEFIFKNKYYGRSVTTEQFPSALSFFLSNGQSVLAYHIPTILSQLYKLAEIVHDLNSYRFYAASLLFIYDGDETVQKNYRQSLIAQAAKRGVGKLSTMVDEDEENELLASMSRHQSNGRTDDIKVPIEVPGSVAIPSANPVSNVPNMSPKTPTKLHPGVEYQNGHHHHEHNTTHRHKRKRTKVPGAVTIRLIDFARCSTGEDYIVPDENGNYERGPNDDRVIATYPPTHPDRPDLGFLLGLKSLSAALKIIWSDVTHEAPNDLHVQGEEVFERIFGKGASQQRFGDGPGPEDIWNFEELVTA